MYGLNSALNSRLVSTDDSCKALVEIENFVKRSLFNLSDEYDLNSHPDFKLISCGDAIHISVEQIRELDSFLRLKPIGSHKVVVIKDADLMTISGANACLKLLEESRDSYIFLISKRPKALLDTIRSRCITISRRFGISRDHEAYESLIELLLQKSYISTIEFVNSLSSKDRNSWNLFASNVLSLWSKRVRASLGIGIDELSITEKRLLESMKREDINLTINKLERMLKLADDTLKYDLDIKSATLLLLSYFE